MEKLGNISVGNIDKAGELEICIQGYFAEEEHCDWITKEQAIKLIAHLQEQFGI